MPQKRYAKGKLENVVGQMGFLYVKASVEMLHYTILHMPRHVSFHR